MNDSHDTCSLHVPGGGCTTNIQTRKEMGEASASTGRWWDLGWVSGKAPLRTWHLVVRHEQKETNCANLDCRDLAG